VFTPPAFAGDSLRLSIERGMAQAEYTWQPGSAPRWFTCPKTVTHPGTNRAWSRVTTFIETNVLLLSQTGNQEQEVHGKSYANLFIIRSLPLICLFVPCNHHHHHHVACPMVDVAVPTSLLHACRF